MLAKSWGDCSLLSTDFVTLKAFLAEHDVLGACGAETRLRIETDG